MAKHTQTVCQHLENVSRDAIFYELYGLSDKHKARVFQAACGLTMEIAETLRQQLLEAAESGDAIITAAVGYGTRYVIELMVVGPVGSALVRSAWIIREGEDFPRFVSAYVL